jgi:hypothetical protein
MALTDNIIAYYKLDGNSNDSVASNNGTDTSITYNASYAKITQGTYLDANTDVINFSDWGLGTGNWSISFWVQEKTSQTANTYFISGQSGGNLWGFYIGSGATTKIRINHNDSSTDNFFDSTGTLAIDTYSFITFTKSSDTITCYINGTASGSLTGYSSRNFGGSTHNSIGRSGSSATAYIDEVGVWSRALSGAEVTELYNSGSGLAYPFNITSTADNGSFILTGQDATATVGYTSTADNGSFVLTGGDDFATITGGWTNTTKSSTATMTNPSKSATTYSNTSKSSSTWTNQTKS